MDNDIRALINSLYSQIAEANADGKCFVSASFLMSVVTEIEDLHKQLVYYQAYAEELREKLLERAKS